MAANETADEKGDRNEHEAANILKRVYWKGGGDKVDVYSNTVPLRSIDVLTARDPFPV